ncbi:MAG TPA: malate synthase A, partial [Chryseosolibacter sp.]|nr:malate synthase A [Chryseosolibacter sp.]
AFIPSKDEEVNKRAFDQVKADKEREAGQGYDGTWVAHPRLVEIAKEVFDQKLGSEPHQKHVQLTELDVQRDDLLNVAAVPRVISEKGVRTNINVALLYIESWLRGIGAAALYNLMEDAATAEISRAQLWQWVHHNDVILDDGRPMTKDLYKHFEKEEFAKVREMLAGITRDSKRAEQARVILDGLVIRGEFDDFLTLKAYNYLD